VGFDSYARGKFLLSPHTYEVLTYLIGAYADQDGSIDLNQQIIEGMGPYDLSKEAKKVLKHLQLLSTLTDGRDEDILAEINQVKTSKENRRDNALQRWCIKFFADFTRAGDVIMQFLPPEVDNSILDSVIRNLYLSIANDNRSIALNTE
jgi:hypothetical protein